LLEGVKSLAKACNCQKKKKTNRIRWRQRVDPHTHGRRQGGKRMCHGDGCEKKEGRTAQILFL